jgi:DNA-binding SARP family transcriptional activator/ATP/maltotriose-dependent transcriptional regulator MalT
VRTDGGFGARGVPDFGAVISRDRLTSLVGSAPPGLSLFIAPSGYGKSVLAAECARSSWVSRTLWVGLSRSAPLPDAMLRCVVHALSQSEGARIAEASTQARSLRDEPEDLVEAVGRAVSREGDPRGVLLVLDDVCADMPQTVEALVTLGEHVGAMGARLLVTTRSVPPVALSSLHDAQILDRDDLRLTRGEAADVASVQAGRRATVSDIETLYAMCSGHPAMFAVLLRHSTADSDGFVVGSNAPLDLRSRLVYLAETATDLQGRKALYIMALLGRGIPAELPRCGVDATPRQIAAIAAAVPLVGISTDDNDSLSANQFMIHDLAQSVFGSDEFSAEFGAFAESSWPDVVEVLCSRGDVVRAGLIVERRGDTDYLARWLVQWGAELLRQGGAACLDRVLRTLPVGAYVQSPALLLVCARLLQEASQFEEAIEKANVARAIAEHERDEELIAESMLLAGQCYTDLGSYESGLDVLGALMSRRDAVLSKNQQAWALAAMASCSSYLGLSEDALELTARAKLAAADPGTSANIRVYVIAIAGAMSAFVRGDLAESLAHFSRAREADGVSRTQLAKAHGNAGVALCELGRLNRSMESIKTCLDTCLEADKSAYRGAFLPALGAALVGQGAADSGLRQIRSGILLSLDAGDRYGASYNRVYLATALRAVGRAEESLSEAEQALEFFSGLEASSQRELATLEIAASLLSLDDVNAALRAAEAVRSQMSGLNAYHLLRADMVLAEGERRLGRVEQAAARLMNHEWHVLSESSNWQIAMYCRAYPDLLGLFALAIDPERLPSHMLRMILPENAERILLRTRNMLGDDLWRRLGVRLLGDEGFKEYVERDGRPLCRVRLFGGLEVNVGGRIVAEREWRKRKARLLFAMLVIKRGHDVPRDQLFEHLWPEMDESRAKNNLYVIWSAMKNALSPDADKNTPCPYIENAGGVCRVVAESVRSDVDEFERTLSAARSAQASGKAPDALRSYERLAEVYRGELLPGDVYDDWFSQARDEFRTLYTDAMLEAASLLMDADDPVGALTFARRALSHDPWREDLYQAALRSQIAAGQRSAAIETYLQCRSKLSEDLGLDPSAETRALYDQILTMEERPRPGRPYFDDPLFNA